MQKKKWRSQPKTLILLFRFLYLQKLFKSWQKRLKRNILSICLMKQNMMTLKKLAIKFIFKLSVFASSYSLIDGTFNKSYRRQTYRTQYNIKRAASSEFVSSSIPSWQILTAHAQPFRGARDLAFCLKVPLESLLVWASSEDSGETARMRRLAWTFAARIGDKYQIRLTRSKIFLHWNLF